MLEITVTHGSSAAHCHLVSNGFIITLIIFEIILDFKYLGPDLCHDYCLGFAGMFLNNVNEYFS